MNVYDVNQVTVPNTDITWYRHPDGKRWVFNGWALWWEDDNWWLEAPDGWLKVLPGDWSRIYAMSESNFVIAQLEGWDREWWNK